MCLVAASLVIAASGLAAQAASSQATSPPAEVPRVSVSWSAVPLRDVLRAFAAYSGASIVAGPNVSALVTADINDQPWDVALAAILSVHGLIGSENEYGIIRVENMADVTSREGIEPLLTRSYRISYHQATEMEAAIAPLLTDRGTLSVVRATNTLVVTDVARVHGSIAGPLR